MFCTLCIKHNANSRCMSGVWVTKPCTLLRQDKVRKHANSDMHKGSKEREALAAMALADGGIEHAFEKTLQIKKKAVKGAMKILYWLSKNEVAHFTKFESLKDLCIELGCTYLKELNVGGNAKYTSHRIISEWLGIMSQIIEQNILMTVRASPAIGLMADESTDISVTKDLILYARVLCRGDVRVFFLKIIKIADGCAGTIENAILTYLEQADIPISRISSFGSDGAAVMVGAVSGVTTRLKRLNPEMLSVHCINHRLALGVSQAANTVPYLKKFEEILISIYKFYHNSAVRQTGLEEIQTILNDPHLKFKLLCSTRWLSRTQAVDAVRKSLCPLLVSLDREASERMNATALGLATLCKTHMFISTVMLMSDILSHVNKLSLMFQMETIDFSTVKPLIESCILAVKRLKTNPGPAVKSIDTVITALQEEHDITISGITHSPMRVCSQSYASLWQSNRGE